MSELLHYAMLALSCAFVRSTGRNTPIDLEVKDKAGNTALFYALQQKSGKMAKALIAAGAKSSKDLERRAAGVDKGALSGAC